jgi:catechol 2,3-dioxygenase-like lactoylglutathione lyase family enzyme
MSSTADPTEGGSHAVACGCCGRAASARRVTELGSTPVVFICARCAVRAAWRGAGLPWPRRLAHRLAHRLRHDVAASLRREHRRTFHSAIPILPTADVERTTAFWRRIGFEVVERYDGYLLTHGDGVELHFAADAADGEPGSRPLRRSARAFVHVQDASALWKRLHSADVPGVGPVEDHDYGLREFLVTDPDGNRVRFGSPVPE